MLSSCSATTGLYGHPSFPHGLLQHGLQQPLEQSTVLNMGDLAGPGAARPFFRRGANKNEQDTREAILATRGSEGIAKLYLPKRVLRYKQGPVFSET